MKTTFENYTPHTVNLINPETQKETHSFPSRGSVRVGMKGAETENPILKKVEYTELEGMPEPKENTIYILSTIAYDAAKAQGRKDICFPSGRMFRDQDGRILGVEYLAVK